MSVVVDVALGLALVYMLVSLFCSALVEAGSSLFKVRARLLEGEMRRMLGGEQAPKGVLDHALLRDLRGGAQAGARAAMGLPSYVPARTFALVVMDTLAPDSTEAWTIEKLRDGLNTAGFPEGVKKALLPLLNDAGDDIQGARANVERWFDSTMERMSGRYKRGTQATMFALGLAFSLTFNVDSIDIASRLQYDRALREVVVAAAQEAIRDSQQVPGHCDFACCRGSATTRNQWRNAS